MLLLVVTSYSALAAGENFENACNPATESTNSSDYLQFTGFEEVGYPTGWSCFGGASCDPDGNTKVYAGSESAEGTGNSFQSPVNTSSSGIRTSSAWANADTASNTWFVLYMEDNLRFGFGSTNKFYIYDGSDRTSTPDYNTSQWYLFEMIVDYSADNYTGNVYDTTGDRVFTYSGSFTGSHSNPNLVSSASNEGSVDNFRRYIGITCPTGGAPPAPDTASEILEKEAYIEQTGITTINSVSYVPLVSGDVEILNSTWLYGSATIPIFNPASNNQADCRISINSTELNESETSRTLSAGQSGNILLTSFEHYVTPNNYTFGLECKRTGGGSYQVENSTLYVHVLSDLAGNPITSSQYNVTSKAISGLIDTFSITTSGNDTATGFTRALVLEWTASYDYTSTQNMSITTELGGTNCTPVNRYGSNGGLGSVAGVCYLSGVTNSTSYDIKLYGSGTGNISNGVFHVKELILHTNEINSSDLSGTILNSSSPSVVATHNIIVNAGHSTPHLTSEVVISVSTLNGTATPQFFLSDGTSNTSIVGRSVGAGEPGVLGIQGHFEGVSGTETLSLYGSCPGFNCSLGGVELVSYLTNELAIAPNSFEVFVNDTYTGATNNFNLLISNTTYSTTDGSVSVFTLEPLVNVTFPADNSTIPPFFPNNTINHNTTTNLTIQATPWTAIYANEPDGITPVNNFTITYFATNGSGSGNTSTTSGVAYVPLYNGTYDVNISNAVGDDGTAYAIQTKNLTANLFVRNYTFPLLISNSVNITFFDEETGVALVGTDVTLEYFSSLGTSGNETTNTSVMFINLLLPETYTFIYNAPGYDERFYEFTLVNETFNNLNLTLLNSTSSSTVTITVKDTLNNRVEGAKVKILKFDVADNEYDLLEVRTTNFEGQTIAGMILNSPLYQFIVEVDGSPVLTTEGTQIYGTSLTLIVDLITSGGFEEIFNGYNMAGVITFDNATNLVTFTYNDESNTGSQACLTIYRLGTLTTTENQSCSSTTSGILSVSVDNTTGRTYQAVGEITDSASYTHTLDTMFIRFDTTITDEGSSLIMMILMVILFATALSVSVEIAIVAAFSVPLMFSIIGLTALSIGVTTSILVLGLVIAFILGVIRR